MLERSLGRTGRRVSVVGLGTWQLGADWGSVPEHDALALLEASAEAGVTFFDTADVYGDGRSEQIIGRFLAARPDLGITVATKMGRRLEQVPENYSPANFQAWVDRSRRNLGMDKLDLVQLHCPPTEVIDNAATYDVLDDLVERGAIAAYGVSVETVDQAMSAIARPHMASVQIILNAFRLKPLDHVLPAAWRPTSGSSPASPGIGPAVRPLRRRHGLRAGRPPQLQPPWGGLRCGGDLLRRGLRDGRDGRPRVQAPGREPRRAAHACPGRDRLGLAATGCDHR